MIQHSGEHPGTNPTIDEIITEIRSRFSNIMPSVANIPERVRNYVHKVLDRRGVLPDEAINAFVENILNPQNSIIPTQEIIELIQSRSLTDEQIGLVLEHLKKFNEGGIILRIYRALLGNATISIPVGSSIKSPSQKNGSNRIPSLGMPPIREETKITPMQEIMIAGINNVQSSIEHATSILGNTNNDRSLWESCMEKMGLQNKTYQGKKHEYNYYEIFSIIRFIGELLERYPYWESDHIPKRIRYFIQFLIKNGYASGAKYDEIMRDLILAFQNIPQQKREGFERTILIDAHKMISRTIIKVPHSRGNGEETHIKNIYYGYTQTTTSHIILGLLLASGIIPENKCKIYKGAMENRMLEIKDNENCNQEYQALRRLIQVISTILKPANT